MESAEQTMSVILAKNHVDFSGMARGGYRKYGRGAIFVWESEAQAPFTTYRSSYLPLSDRAFHQAGRHPQSMTGDYDPTSEFVVVFVSSDSEVHTVKVGLAPQSTMNQWEV